MSFEQPKFEEPSSEEEGPIRDIEWEEEEEIRVEKLKSVVKETAEKLKAEAVPVKENCRIDMEAFQGVYSQETINKDKDLVESYEKEWRRGLSKKEIEEEKLKSTGEKLEMLKTTVFDKFIGNDFIIARASSYDDIKNKIDNVILEKETGDLVCAFDEVGESSGPRYEEKKTKVLERNEKENGVKLKYGLRIEKDKENKMKLILGEAANIPIFYLALPERYIKKGIEKLAPSIKEKSDYEKKLFSYFVASLDSQIQSLKLEPHLIQLLKERLRNFEEALQRFKEAK